MFSLVGKSIVIIGGTAGLGLSAARACVAAGGCVVVVGRDPQVAADAERELGETAKALVGDATDPTVAGRAIELAIAQFGGMHGLYHVAGGSGRRRGDGPLHEIPDEGWDFTVELNLTALFYSNRAAVRHLLSTGGGSIVNMGSVLGEFPSPAFFTTHAYAATKAAVIGLTRSCAAYYAPKNIRFNVIAPALVETPMAERAVGDERIREFIRTKQPLDGARVGVPSDCDGAALLLLSDAGRYMTGQVLHVDGGWSVCEGQIPPAVTAGGPA